MLSTVKVTRMYKLQVVAGSFHGDRLQPKNTQLNVYLELMYTVGLERTAAAVLEVHRA